MNIKFIIRLVVISFLSFTFGYFLTKCNKKAKVDFKVGQTWEHFYDIDDPFKKVHCQRKIVDIKDGYVLYVEEDGDTLSGSARWFRRESRLIKETE